MPPEREGVILSYRLGRKTQRPRECIIKVEGVGPSEAGGLIGWCVDWPAGKAKVHGKIMGLHGRGGLLRARFKKGVPGQALSSRVRLYEKAERE